MYACPVLLLNELKKGFPFNKPPLQLELRDYLYGILWLLSLKIFIRHNETHSIIMPCVMNGVYMYSFLLTRVNLRSIAT